MIVVNPSRTYDFRFLLRDWVKGAKDTRCASLLLPPHETLPLRNESEKLVQSGCAASSGGLAPIAVQSSFAFNGPSGLAGSRPKVYAVEGVAQGKGIKGAVCTEPEKKRFTGRRIGRDARLERRKLCLQTSSNTAAELRISCGVACSLPKLCIGVCGEPAPTPPLKHAASVEHSYFSLAPNRFYVM